MKKTKMFSNGFLVAMFALGIIAAAIFLPNPFPIRSKPPLNTCINNLRMLDPRANKELIELNRWVLAVVPPGTSFSNAVAILGNDFETSPTNAEGSFFVNFNFTLPGKTNQSSETFLVKSNIMVGTIYIKTGYPKKFMSPPATGQTLNR